LGNLRQYRRGFLILKPRRLVAGFKYDDML
jgi:hypothetical protein